MHFKLYSRIKTSTINNATSQLISFRRAGGRMEGLAEPPCLDASPFSSEWEFERRTYSRASLAESADKETTLR